MDFEIVGGVLSYTLRAYPPYLHQNLQKDDDLDLIHQAYEHHSDAIA